MRKGFGLVFALVVVLVTATPSAGAAPPATPERLTGDVQGVHDPMLVREGDTWYVFSTNEGIGIRRSSDLQHWERVGSVFDEIPDWVYDEVPTLRPAERLAWAPDVSYHDGRWHLYWSVAEFGTPDAVIGLATNTTLDPDDPDYEWVDEGMVSASNPGDTIVSIDPNAVTDDNGDRWLVWGSFWDGIYTRRLDGENGKFLPGGQAVNIGRRQYWWQGIEGAFVFERDGWWYLVASFGFCCKGVDSTYSTHIGRSRSVTGPYIDAAGKPMLEDGGTTLVGTYGDVIGPGHGSIAEVDGSLVYAHHYYDRRADGVPTLGLRELIWGPDGWPVAVDPGFARGTPQAASVTGQWRLEGYPQECPARSPDEATLTLRPDGSVSPSGRWEIDPAANVLRITGVDVAGERRDWWLLVDGAATAGFGRDNRTAAIRAAPVSGQPDATTTRAPCWPGTPAESPVYDAPPPAAPAVAGRPGFTG